MSRRDTALDLFLIFLAVAGVCAVLGLADQIDHFLITGCIQ
jgi:hypothetical protein